MGESNREKEREESRAIALVRRRRKKREREIFDYQCSLEKSYKITTLHFSFCVTPTRGAGYSASTSMVTRGAAFTCQRRSR